MIENLQDELYQLENKEAKGAKLGANIRQEVEGEKCSKTFFRALSSLDQGQISIKLGQNRLYNESQQIFCRKKMSMLTGLKMSSLAYKCVTFTEQNIIQRGEGRHGTEF